MSALVVALLSEVPEPTLAAILRKLPDSELVELVRRGVEAQDFAAAVARPPAPAETDEVDEDEDLDEDDEEVGIDAVILRHLDRAGEDGTSTTPIVEELGVTGQTVRKHLRRLEQEGQAKRTGAGPSTRWHAAD